MRIAMRIASRTTMRMVAVGKAEGYVSMVAYRDCSIRSQDDGRLAGT
jgi:hypothetical protein